MKTCMRHYITTHIGKCEWTEVDEEGNTKKEIVDSLIWVAFLKFLRTLSRIDVISVESSNNSVTIFYWR